MDRKNLDFPIILRCICFVMLIAFFRYCSDPVAVDATKSKPVITSTPVVTGIVDEQYVYNVNATGFPKPTYSIVAPPAGMTINAQTGVISWIPSGSSDFKVTVRVKATNELGTDIQTYDIRIAGLQVDGWETGIFSMVNMKKANIDSVLFLRQNGCYPYIHSIIIIKNSKLVLEEYFRGIPLYWPFDFRSEIQFTRSMTHHNASVTKSIVSILMGIALENDYIASLEESPFDFFPEYDSYHNWSEIKNQMTLRHLISMTTGFEWYGDQGSFFPLIFLTDDWVKSFLDLPVVHIPGTYWQYVTPSPDILGAVISRTSGLALSEFAKQYLLDPLDITDVEWYTTPGGRAFGGGCHRMRPLDMAKIGYLLLNNGVWKDQQILSPEWIAESTLERHPNYAYLWWKLSMKIDNDFIEITYAAGHGGQRIFIVPELDMVVVFTSGYYDDNQLGATHTYEILKRYIVPSVFH